LKASSFAALNCECNSVESFEGLIAQKVDRSFDHTSRCYCEWCTALESSSQIGEYRLLHNTKGGYISVLGELFNTHCILATMDLFYLLLVKVADSYLYSTSFVSIYNLKENKNIKNLKRCRDGMPKSMQTK